MYRKSEKSLIWCRLLDINLCLASQKCAQGQLLLCLLWLQGLWHDQIFSLVFFGESREVEVCARERPQEPDFPRGSRVRTSLGDPDVQDPFCNHSHFSCWGGRLWTVGLYCQSSYRRWQEQKVGARSEFVSNVNDVFPWSYLELPFA